MNHVKVYQRQWKQLSFLILLIDVDQNSAAAIEYGIRGVPHLILLDENNNIIKRVGGNVSKQILIEQLVETI